MALMRASCLLMLRPHPGVELMAAKYLWGELRTGGLVPLVYEASRDPGVQRYKPSYARSSSGMSAGDTATVLLAGRKRLRDGA